MFQEIAQVRCHFGMLQGFHRFVTFQIFVPFEAHETFTCKYELVVAKDQRDVQTFMKAQSSTTFHVYETK